MRGRFPIVLLVVDLNLLFAWPLLDPFLGGGAAAALLLALAALHVAAWRGPPA